MSDPFVDPFHVRPNEASREGTVDHGGLMRFAGRWADAVIRTSYVPMGRVELTGFLADGARELIAALREPRFRPARVAQVARSMVAVHLVAPEALRLSLELIADELTDVALDTGGSARNRPADPTRIRQRLVELMAAFATGFTDAVKQRVLAEQGVIQQAVLNARDAAEEAVRASEARFRAVFTSSALGIAIVGLDGRIEDANESMATIFRTTREDLVDRSMFELADSDWSPKLRKVVGELIEEKRQDYAVDVRFTVPDETQVWTQVCGSLVHDGKGIPEYQVVLYGDITNRCLLEQQLHRQATRDPLTGLANRTLLHSKLEEALTPTRPNRRVGICYLDLDGFKAINDSLGHPIGDELLCDVARRIDRLADEYNARAARMGGDEFVVLLADTEGAAGVVELVQRLIREIESPVRIGGHELVASASVGVVERPIAGTDGPELLRDADVTLYRAKAEGKAQWVLFDAARNEVARRRFRLSAGMPAALDSHEFFVEYLPIRRIGDGGLVAAQAEPRWDHPEFGELTAAQFLEMAEETGVIIRLGDWLLRRACEHAVRWVNDLGENAPAVAVNLSARHFADPDLVGDLKRILADTGLSPSRLRLGIPESALFDEDGDPVDTIDILHEIGVGLAVRDFGFDFTGSAKLRGLPIEAVGIGGNHVDGLGRADSADPLREHLVRSLVDAARLLNVSVVAGGVHTAEQAGLLATMGVHAVRGDYAGPAAAAMEIELMLADGAQGKN